MNDKQSRGAGRSRIATIPNLLSLFRLCLIPLLIWLYSVRGDSLWTGAVLLLSGLTDVADGWIARRFDMSSDLGRVLDPAADKLTQAAMLYCLLTRFPLMAVPLVLLVFKELFVGGTGLLVLRRTGRVLGANWHGKAAAVLLYAMMTLHLLWYGIPPLASGLSIAVCVAAMLLSLVLYGLRNLRLLQERGR